jgi:hypothetical protein
MSKPASSSSSSSHSSSSSVFSGFLVVGVRGRNEGCAMQFGHMNNNNDDNKVGRLRETEAFNCWKGCEVL